MQLVELRKSLSGTLAEQSPAFLDAFGTSAGIDENFVHVGGTTPARRHLIRRDERY